METDVKETIGETAQPRRTRGRQSTDRNSVQTRAFGKEREGAAAAYT
jgi:hypothetical protein